MILLQMKQKSMHIQCIYFKYISITGHLYKKKQNKNKTKQNPILVTYMTQWLHSDWWNRSFPVYEVAYLTISATYFHWWVEQC